MMLVEDFKKGINNRLKEIQENTAKQVETLKEEGQKSLKELQEKNKQIGDGIEKNIQDLKLEVETMKKIQRETTVGVETLGKKSGTIDASISNRIQEMEERISGAEDSIGREHGHSYQRKCKMQYDPSSKHPGNPGHNEKTKPTHSRNR